MSRAREGAELITAYDTGTPLGFRNRLINSDMRIDQRNAGASVNLTGNGNFYTIDRWTGGGVNGGVMAFQQVADGPTGFTNSLRVTVSTADSSLSSTEYARVGQIIEGFNVADFAGGTANAITITFSFWVKSSLTGTFGGYLSSGDESRLYVFQYTINAANTWEYKTVTVALPSSGTWATNNSAGMRAFFSLGSGSSYVNTANTWLTSYAQQASGNVNVINTLNATWQITGVQLEAGSVATPFERRPYSTELQLAQRYYVNVVSGGSSIATGFMWNTSELGSITCVPVTMRSAPSLVQTTGTAYYAFERAAGNQTFSSFLNVVRWAGQQGYLYASSSGTTGHVGELRGNNAASYIAFSSEL
jgi:hypothetical protein